MAAQHQTPAPSPVASAASAIEMQPLPRFTLAKYRMPYPSQGQRLQRSVLRQTNMPFGYHLRTTSEAAAWALERVRPPWIDIKPLAPLSGPFRYLARSPHPATAAAPDILHSAVVKIYRIYWQQWILLLLPKSLQLASALQGEQAAKIRAAQDWTSAHVAHAGEARNQAEQRSHAAHNHHDHRHGHERSDSHSEEGPSSTVPQITDSTQHHAIPVVNPLAPLVHVTDIDIAGFHNKEEEQQVLTKLLSHHDLLVMTGPSTFIQFGLHTPTHDPRIAWRHIQHVHDYNCLQRSLDASHPPPTIQGLAVALDLLAIRASTPAARLARAQWRTSIRRSYPALVPEDPVWHCSEVNDVPGFGRLDLDAATRTPLKDDAIFLDDIGPFDTHKIPIPSRTTSPRDDPRFEIFAFHIESIVSRLLDWNGHVLAQVKEEYNLDMSTRLQHVQRFGDVVVSGEAHERITRPHLRADFDGNRMFELPYQSQLTVMQMIRGESEVGQAFKVDAFRQQRHQMVAYTEVRFPQSLQICISQIELQARWEARDKGKASAT